MTQIIVGFVLLNLAIGALLAAGIIGIGQHAWQELLALELAQVLGAMQAVMFYTLWRQK